NAASAREAAFHHTAHFFSFNHPPPPEISTLSLHDALPIYRAGARRRGADPRPSAAVQYLGARGGAALRGGGQRPSAARPVHPGRSEEHTSELQSLRHLVCRLLLEKKNTRR